MLCTRCNKSLRFNGVGQRGQGKNREKWRCKCGYVEYFQIWNEEYFESRSKKKSRSTRTPKASSKKKMRKLKTKGKVKIKRKRKTK